MIFRSDFGESILDAFANKFFPDFGVVFSHGSWVECFDAVLMAPQPGHRHQS